MDAPRREPDWHNYRRLFRAYVLALLGTGIAVVAVALLAFNLAGDDAGEVIGIALSIKVFTYVVVPPLAAALTGRVPKRPLLIALDLVRAAVILTLPWVTSPLQLYAVIFVFTSASAIFTPTYQALVPQLLPDEADYARALSKSSVALELDNAVSPLLAAALLMVLSVRGLFGVVVGMFLLSALFLRNAELPRLRSAPRSDLLTQLALGPRLMLATPGLRSLIPLNLAAAAATAMVMVNTVVFVQGDLARDARASAIALAAFGAGSVAGALAVPRLLNHLSDRVVVLAGCVVLVAGLLLGSRTDTYAGLLGLWAMIGLGVAMALTPAPFLLRRLASQHHHTVLYATLFSLTNASLLIAYPAAGWLGAEAGLDTAFVALGAAAALATVATAFTWPGARSLAEAPRY